ncbi:MAG: PQQ-binding-like beta-propeller repeat protein [Acidimicrobiales bacterium]
MPVVLNNTDYAGAPGADLVYLTGSGASARAAWSQQLQGVAPTGSSGLTTTADAVYVWGPGGITALDRASGSMRWRSSTPVDDARAAGSTLIVTTSDSSVQGFAIGGPDPRWTSRPASQPTTRIEVVADDIVLVHRMTADGSGSTVTRLDPASGATIAAADPGCAFSYDATSFLVPGTGDVVSVPNDFADCWYRWDARSGQVRWTRQGARPTSGRPAPLFDGQEAVGEAPGGGIEVVDVATGAQRTITGPGAWKIWPRWVGAGIIVAEGVSDEPTPRTAIFGFEAATGDQLWSRTAPAGALPIDVDGVDLPRDLEARLPAQGGQVLVGGGSTSPRLYLLQDDDSTVHREDLDRFTGRSTSTEDSPVTATTTTDGATLAGESRRAAVVRWNGKIVVLPWGLGYQVGDYPT